MVFGAGSDEKSVASTIGVNPFFVKEYVRASRLYSYPEIEKALLLLHQYNLRSVGVRDTGTEDASLLREMAVRIMA
jgi:DNA polymerase-3 subunit delta